MTTYKFKKKKTETPGLRGKVPNIPNTIKYEKTGSKFVSLMSGYKTI